MDHDLIKELTLIGLTSREAHIYLALLQKKEFAASEIASIIPVGRTKIYEVIPRLITMGFCNEIQKDGKKIYRAVEPKIALHNRLTTYEQELKGITLEKEKLIEETFRKKEEIIEFKKKTADILKKKLDNIYSSNLEKSDNLDYIEVLKDKNQIRQRWIELQQNTRFEMLGFNKLPYSITYDENMKHQQKMMKKKKIHSKGIYEYGDLLSEASLTDFFDVVEYFESIGEECRIVDKLPMKLMIMDEKVTMLSLIDPVSMKSSTTTLIVAHPSYALAQKLVFDNYWNKGEPLTEFKKKFKK